MTDDAGSPVLCATCGGDGLDGSHNAALFYAYSGKLTTCDTCNGTGLVNTDSPTPPPTS